MNDEEKRSLPITVGDQTFRIRVHPDEAARYERVAAIANQVLEQVVASGTLHGPRAQAMALFQLAAELDDAREVLTDSRKSRDRLRQLIDRIDQATEGSGERRA